MNGICNGAWRGIEPMESRVLLSLMFHQDFDAAPAKGGKPQPPSEPPAIRLDMVALHELGHSLGLEHDRNQRTISIMDPYYNPNYNLANFLNDPAVAKLRQIYQTVESGYWKDSREVSGTQGNGHVDITYSFMRDGSATDDGTSALWTRFGTGSDWQNVITDQLGRWASASNGLLAFSAVTEPSVTGVFPAPGAVQGDANLGDIRIGAHYFDGGGGVLAHAYYPSNTSSVAGDLHFDIGDKWVLSNGTPLGAPMAAPVTSSSTGVFSTARIAVEAAAPAGEAVVVEGRIKDLLGSASQMQLL